MVLLLVAVILFASLGRRGLNEPDEGRYAEIGREMVESGDWLIPRLNGIENFQKPPMIYWATALSLKLFGNNEAAARLPSALAALGTVVLTAYMASRLFGQGRGVIAAFVLVSSGEFFLLGRMLTPDMMLTFWVTAAIAALVAYVQGGFRAGRWLFFVAMGLGFLTKGPMALVVPIFAAVFWQWGARRRQTAFRLPWLLGMLMTLAIGLSWFVVVSVRDHQLFDYFVRYELVQRFASHAHGRSKPMWFFVPVLLGGFLPWTFFVPGVVRAIWRDGAGSRPWMPSTFLFLGWILPPLVILSLSGSKLPTYVLPLFPGMTLALIGAWNLQMPQFRQRSAILAVAILLVFMPALLRISPFLLSLTQPIVISWWTIGAAIVIAAVAALLLGTVQWSNQSMPVVIALLMAPMWLLLVNLSDHASGLLAQQASVRSLVKILQQQPDAASARLFACEVRAHGFEFYTQRLVDMTRAEADVVVPPRPEAEDRLAEDPEELARTGSESEVVYGIVRRNRFVRSFESRGWRSIGISGDFVLVQKLGRPLAQVEPPR